MTQNLFSVTIFFVVFREAVEACLIISVLLSLVEQILHKDTETTSTGTATQLPDTTPPDLESTPTPITPRLLRKLRLQVCMRLLHRNPPPTRFPGPLRRVGWPSWRHCYWCNVHRHLVHSGKRPLDERGTVMGRYVSLATSCQNNPDPCLGIFELVASLMIFVMGVTMLKMEHARTKWRIKLQNAFNTQRTCIFRVPDVFLTSFLRT